MLRTEVRAPHESENVAGRLRGARAPRGGAVALTKASSFAVSQNDRQHDQSNQDRDGDLDPAQRVLAGDFAGGSVHGDLIVFADPPTLAYGENVKLKNLTKDGSERSISLHTGTRNLSNVSAKELLLRKSLVESTLRLDD